jgi:hypothetical protein
VNDWSHASQGLPELVYPRKAEGRATTFLKDLANPRQQQLRNFTEKSYTGNAEERKVCVQSCRKT